VELVRPSLEAIHQRQLAARDHLSLPCGSPPSLATSNPMASYAPWKLVLLFDEFEAVTRNERFGPEFYGACAPLRTATLWLSSRRPAELERVMRFKADGGAPVFNIFAVQHLGPFLEEEARMLIRRPSLERGIPLEPLEEPILAMGGCCRSSCR